jgi:hypothetical protein
MNRSSEELYRSHNFSEQEIKAIGERIKSLPNLGCLKTEEDKAFGCAIQKLVARQDPEEAKATIRKQIGSPSPCQTKTES